jgi:hypothetical protein
MISVSTALSAIPPGLRDPLIVEYQGIVQNFLEQRWRPTELQAAIFSEIAYTILDGHAKGVYPAGPSKPRDMVGACRLLENNAHVPRSFQILIPRMLPALYEVRNNRNVGHTDGDVDPNHMDSVVVLSICNWIMGELVRVYHSLSVGDAQSVVDALAEVRVPLIWTNGVVKRILDPKLSLQEHILLLAGATVPSATATQLLSWIEYEDEKYFMRTIRNLHKKRLVEYDKNSGTVQVLPTGAAVVQTIIRQRKLAGFPKPPATFPRPICQKLVKRPNGRIFL